MKLTDIRLLTATLALGFAVACDGGKTCDSGDTGCDTGETDTDTDTDADSDTDSDADTDSDTDTDTGVIAIGWYGEVDNTFTGFTNIWVYYLKTDSLLCEYQWDTTGVAALSTCDSCDFAWEYSHSNGTSADLAACEAIFGELGEDYPLSNNSRGFASEWTSDYSGNTYNDVLMQYFGSPYYAWYGIAYADYTDGLLTYQTVNGYYYY